MLRKNLCFLLKGNAVMTLKAKDAIKVVTVRGTAFEPAASGSGSGAIEAVKDAPAGTGISEFVKQELAKSDRPELTAAKSIVSGGRFFFQITM